jgi:hypothetical protein
MGAKMQIKKLIEILQKYPPETRVMVDGYEGGFDEIEERRIKKITVQKLDKHEECEGEFEEQEIAKNDNPAFEAIILSRKSF